jgi:hypothetical protein
MLGCFDNCLCKFGTSYEGIRDDGDGWTSYLFINWFLAPIDSEDVPADFNPLEGKHIAFFFTTVSLALPFNHLCITKRNLDWNNHGYHDSELALRRQSKICP